MVTNMPHRKTASIGAMRLFILSVSGSALPIPPQDPHINPCWFERRHLGSSFLIAQA
ncbi:hypothetical protein SAMN04487963_1130 [Marinobacter zhejiangensis]|uniref:Uncharacterized protein n=1 Tax=Marinobacter zhejiangensis TaxID=488535 RepID=A0A1I4N5B5_9GAMM|nr:hypothetical protein SAMN04487963_1130 [Marinobacter zhejiangensis]